LALERQSDVAPIFFHVPRSLLRTKKLTAPIMHRMNLRDITTYMVVSFLQSVRLKRS
jgi:hypothetical protein